MTKSVIGEKIKTLRSNKELSQEAFGKPLGLTRSALSQIESGTIYPSIETLEKIVHAYGISWDELMETRKRKILSKQESLKTLVTTVDTTGRDTISLVPVKAQAGYLMGLQQPEYIQRLPSFWLPGLSNGTFRAFEVSGYSMLYDRIGFYPGDIVIGEYVEKLEEIKDGLVYVLVNNAQEVDDVILKRCLNYLNKGGLIICKSDNKDPQYPTFSLSAESIKEVWRFKMRISRQAPEPSGLFERFNAVEGDIALIKEQMRKFLK